MASDKNQKFVELTVRAYEGGSITISHPDATDSVSVGVYIDVLVSAIKVLTARHLLGISGQYDNAVNS